MAAQVNRPMTEALRMRLGMLIAVVALSSGCAKEPSATLSSAKPSVTPQIVEMGRRLYNKQCAVCHGPKGAGDGQAAYLLYPKPRDFTQNEFRLVSTSTMQATDEDLFLTITRGTPGSAMPSWETLTSTPTSSCGISSTTFNRSYRRESRIASACMHGASAPIGSEATSH